MTIHIPKDWHNELAARAARQSQSLQEFMLAQIEIIVACPPLDLVVERARRRARAAHVRLDVDDLLAERDADRG